MIRLTDGTTIREVSVNGGEGSYAYYIHFTTVNGLPEVGLEKTLRLHDARLAGFYFRHKDRDWLVVRGMPKMPTPEQIVELDRWLVDSTRN